MPIDYRKYPPNWRSEIRPRILKRAGEVRRKVPYRAGCCGTRVKEVVTIEARCEDCGAQNRHPHPETGSRVVLTVHHMDHDPENWDVKDDRLKALCQRCHLRRDREHRQRRKGSE